eukprot:CAMPEP_0170540782 /NCGR_PEP_ID=MMETSP0211-20121228/721_1 /TAXON_ID=311385 /ORGANISM="Pseudokeronopsis sp., Strain OXSARD2" /LENGTH=32 /DNA_ID= /DNA_START= /DNA_END= /DNA_ORIENTATION=
MVKYGVHTLKNEEEGLQVTALIDTSIYGIVLP